MDRLTRRTEADAVSPLLPRLWSLAARFRGWSYGPLDHARRTVDCTAFAASILQDAWGADVVTRDVWRDLNLSRPEHVGRPWAPVEAAAAIVGDLPTYPYHGPAQPVPGRVHLCQGWRGLTDQGIGPASRGHAWLWLSCGGWDGVVLESSGDGPRVWDGHGRRPLAEVVSSDGALAGPLAPMDWGQRANKWTSGTAWAVLP